MRLIDDEGENLGVFSKKDALIKAGEEGLDLVLISPVGDIPTAKILDWSKFKYTQSKKQKKQTKALEIKEWWYKPNIENHDIEVKHRQVKKYVKKGGKAKLTVKYKRRTSYEDMHSTMQRVVELAEPFTEAISEVAKSGKNLSIIVKYKQDEQKEEEK